MACQNRKIRIHCLRQILPNTYLPQNMALSQLLIHESDYVSDFLSADEQMKKLWYTYTMRFVQT